jgi:hypothetical protein
LVYALSVLLLFVAIGLAKNLWSDNRQSKFFYIICCFNIFLEFLHDFVLLLLALLENVLCGFIDLLSIYHTEFTWYGHKNLVNTVLTAAVKERKKERLFIFSTTAHLNEHNYRIDF